MTRVVTEAPGIAANELLARAAEAEALGRSLLDMAQRLRDDARCRDGGAEPAPHEPPADPPVAAARTADPASLATAAAGLLALRQRRLRHLGLALAGEAAWDILLTLFAARLARRQSTFEQLCGTNAAYASTTRRWITVLTGLGLVEQHGPASDPRQRLELTRKGERAMAECLNGMTLPR